MACDASCTTCSGALSTQCLSCAGSLYLNTASNSCLSTCPNGTYKNTTTHICTSCHSSCTTCSAGTSTDCLTCTVPLYYQTSTKQCVSTCNNGQYPAPTPTPLCTACYSSCTTCSGGASNQCLSCSGTLYLNTGTSTCLSTCPNGTYKNTSNNVCTACDPTCTTCSGGGASLCLSCTVPLYY